MTTTPHLALPLLAAAQAQKHVTHNEALASLDALVHLAVKERGRTAPPATPADGDRYLVGTGATGAFSGQDTTIALFDLGTWRFFTPRPGWRVFVEAEEAIIAFDGSQWRDIGHYCSIIDNLDRFGLGASPDDLNRFSAKLNAALFASLDGDEGGTGDLRLALNKTETGKVLSQLYQRGFSGRAEMGLIGNDDFSIRVSPDGSGWSDAMIIDACTGVGSFPQGLSNVPRANLLINTAFRVNQRAFAGGALAEGAYGFDRWKGGPGGCSISRAADGTVTLTGTLDQVVDLAHAAALAGAANLAGATLTLSVRDPSGPLPVVMGSKTATIPAGPGRRSVTVALGADETGHVLVRLAPTGTCSFKHVKLELGSYATPWVGESPDAEELRCRRYYQPLPISGSSPGVLGGLCQKVGTNALDIPLTLPVPMRANPVLVTSNPTWVSALPANNQIAFYSNSTSVWIAISGTLTLGTAVPGSPSSVVLRCQASSVFSGASGIIGNLYVGGSVVLALQAEL
ncbi:MAG TPA: DUF2793 domain-containing protein [Microvirga sp.]|nr:DUF2793 domain-containing protein [Microvirga sp.]